MGSIRFNCVAKVINACLIGFPAANLGVVVEGGQVNIDIISLAA